MKNNISKQLAEAFMSCPLPDLVCSDLSATMPNTPHRTGTNLLSLVQAQEMFEQILPAILTNTEQQIKHAIPELKQNEIYAGAIINPDGTGHHVILLDGDHDDTDWQSAMNWAKEQGGDLPNRVETALLFNQSKDQFKPEWYWTNEQHASRSDCAWCQLFSHGDQNGYREFNELRARAVRRLAI